MSQSQCSACSPTLIQRRVLLASLRKRLVKFNLEYQPDFREENETQVLNDLAFNRLIQIIFNDDSTLSKPNSKCTHHRFVRYLRRKLKCNSQTFNDLCNQLILRIAQRNYQLNVLAMQIKSAQITSLLLVQNTHNSRLIEQQVRKREEEMEFDTKQSLNLKGFKQNKLQKESAQLIVANIAMIKQASFLPTSKQQSN